MIILNFEFFHLETRDQRKNNGYEINTSILDPTSGVNFGVKVEFLPLETRDHRKNNGYEINALILNPTLVYQFSPLLIHFMFSIYCST